MKRHQFFLRVLLVLAVPAASTLSFAGEGQSSSKGCERYSVLTRHATVFAQGAELEQEATISLTAGDNTVVIEGIYPYLDQQSLQITLGGGVIVQQYSFSQDYLSADKLRHNTASLEDSLRIAQGLLESTNRTISTLGSMQSLLQNGVNSSLTAQTGVTTAVIEKNLSFYQSRAMQLAAELDAAKAEQTRLNALITALKRQISEEQGAHLTRSGLITLQINSPKSQRLKAQIKYFTPQASWYPSYDLQLSRMGEPMTVVMKAHVSQNTGLSWEHTSLTLSTGNPSSHSEAPELSVWRLQRSTAYANRSMKAAGVALYTAAAATMDMSMDEEAEVAEAVVLSLGGNNLVTANDQALSVNYDIAIPYTIEGNGKEQMIALLNRDLSDIEYSYYSAPKLSQKAYLLAYLTNWSEQQLPDGQANLNYAGTYLGQTWLQSSADKARVRLTLGDDPQVKIKRELIDQQTKQQGSNKITTYTYRTTLRNDKREAVNISVHDQYPVSGDKQIQVSLGDKNTAFTTEDKQQGLVSYELLLQPGETKTITLSYSIKQPKE